jgi:exodeoxyribonuclease VII large subunit
VSRRDSALRASLDHRRADLARLGAEMAAMSPLAVLDRGYAMVRAGESIVRDAASVKPRDRLHVRLARGSLEVIVDRATEEGGSK